jgi:NADH:ubiquinone oxidoreductase subunit 6 (subunit J)/NADH:ubiquinone oxidoreductase subunit K
MLVEILFWAFSAVLVGAALGVILSRNPVHSVLYLVLCFFNAAVLWLLIQAEFLAIVLVLVYVGAVMVLFLFVVMMLDINIEELREGFARNAPLGALIAFIMVVELCYVLWVRRLGIELPGAVPEEHGRDRRRAVHAVRLSVPAGGSRTADRDRGRNHADHAPAAGPQGPGHREAGGSQGRGPRPPGQHAAGARAVIGLAHYLLLAGVLFAIAVAGIFINRKNVILLLMCIELMLLAVNFNFVAFSRFLGNLDGQVFVFFILTVAAAEAAIGLAILVVLFRQRRSINVEELDTMKG